MVLHRPNNSAHSLKARWWQTQMEQHLNITLQSNLFTQPIPFICIGLRRTILLYVSIQSISLTPKGDEISVGCWDSFPTRSQRTSKPSACSWEVNWSFFFVLFTLSYATFLFQNGMKKKMSNLQRTKLFTRIESLYRKAMEGKGTSRFPNFDSFRWIIKFGLESQFWSISVSYFWLRAKESCKKEETEWFRFFFIELSVRIRICIDNTNQKARRLIPIR